MIVTATHAPLSLESRPGPTGDMHRVGCSCGSWRGSWHSSPAEATAAWQRHHDREVRPSPILNVSTCCRCRLPIRGDLVPAKDAATGGDVCESCQRVERHLLRRSA